MTSLDAPTEDLCICERFHLWYAEDGAIVCRCGHRDTEHLLLRLACTGLVERFRGTNQTI